MGTVIDPWWTVAECQQAYATERGLPVAVENGQGQRFALLAPGAFLMGSTESESGRYVAEGPQHEAQIGHAFYLAATETTNAAYRQYNPEHSSKDVDGRSLDGDVQPAVYVSWNAAREYCAWLTEQERQAGRLPAGWGYRLPTEAEWEYACHAGTTEAYSFGQSAHGLREYGWYERNSGGTTQAVAQKRANPWGLYDMHGNVWEWCRSVLKAYPYRADDGRESLTTPGMRVLRGGAWLNEARNCRSADRGARNPDDAYDIFGFRVALAPAHED